MVSEVKVFVVCGLGIVIFMVVQEKVKEILWDVKIFVKIIKGIVGQLLVFQNGVDVIMLMICYGKLLNKFVIQVFGFILGINEDVVVEEIIFMC